MSEINHALDWFNEQVTNHLNIEMGVVGGTERSFRIDSTMEEEAYTLEISESGIAISAGGGKGVFYALTSLYQMMAASDEGTLPAVRIEDTPRFEWRGMHLDVARHFFSVEEVKRYIDYLALYKMNTFHWHLTEDQGWRIEIKQYPKLTEIGAWRKGTMVGHYRDQTWDSVRYGGFYTQEDIKEVVAYAQKRFITVVPEIEMPGHSLAALAAYPELACTDGPFEVGTSWGVYEDVYCPKEETFAFLENVLLEVMELFPSEYIHIGGDEVPKKRWKECAYCQELMAREGLANEEELQSWFIQRIERFLNSHGRQIIGWDEILEGGLAPNAAVMSWRGTQGGIEAAKEQHKVVMSPGSPCYFDHYQVQPTDQEPIAIGGFNPLDRVYAYEPVPAELGPEEAEYIMGAQGNVWTEYMKTFEHVEYMALPRMAALAEVLWTPSAQKEYTGFLERLRSNTRILDYRGANYARHFLNEME
jgi:hexosaminidase